MSKNIIIGLLVVAVLVGGGIYLSQNSSNEADIPDTAKNDNDPTTPTPKTPTVPPVVIPSPDAPTVQTSANYAVSISTATVAGTVKPNGASTNYWFEYGETTALGSRTSSQDIGSGFMTSATPAYITGLKSNTTYYFRLSAKNKFATVNGTTYTLKTNNTPPPSGFAPTAKTLAATDVARTTANLKGQVNPKGSETRYWFEYGKDINFGNVTTLENLASGNAVVSIAVSVSSLEPLTKYYFRLNAQNQYGTVNGTIVNFTTKGPATSSAPTVKTNQASNVTSTGATLNGSVNPNGVETTYWFEYSLEPMLKSLIGNGTTVQTLASGSNSVDVKATLTGLNKSTKYYYRLVAKNVHGVVKNNIVSFTTRN